MKIYKRKINANSHKFSKKAVMAGAGAGIILEFDRFDIDKILNYDVNGAIVTGTAAGTIDMTSIGTYYDGGRYEETVPCEFDFELDFETEEHLQEEIDEYGIEDVITRFGGTSNFKAYIGGGWTHVTFTGEFDFESYDWDDVGNFHVQITDSELVEYLDMFAHGELDDDEEYYE